MGSILENNKLSHRTKFCVNLVKKKDILSKKILDIGSTNTYWMSKFFSKQGAKSVIAIDPDITTELTRDKLYAFKANVFDKRLNKLKFHTVVFFDVIEHIPRNTELKTLIRINKLLHKNGRLYLSTPNDNLLMNIMDPAWYFGHRHYSMEKLSKIFKKSGYKIIKKGTVGGFFESLRVLSLYVQKHILRRNEISYPLWLWQKSSHEFKRDGIMSNWIVAVKI